MIGGQPPECQPPENKAFLAHFHALKARGRIFRIPGVPVPVGKDHPHYSPKGRPRLEGGESGFPGTSQRFGPRKPSGGERFPARPCPAVRA
jgi:hypothetical protein